MKTSSKLLLGLFCLILASLITINIILKIVISKEPSEKDKLTIINSNTGNTLLISSTDVFFSIYRNTSITEINNLKTKLKEVNIDLNVEKIEYDTDNKIKSIDISAKTYASLNGSNGSSYGGPLWECEKIIFYRSFENGVKSSFVMFSDGISVRSITNNPRPNHFKNIK
jgi:hypothetical protein